MRLLLESVENEKNANYDVNNYKNRSTLNLYLRGNSHGEPETYKPNSKKALLKMKDIICSNIKIEK